MFVPVVCVIGAPETTGERLICLQEEANSQLDVTERGSAGKMRWAGLPTALLIALLLGCTFLLVYHASATAKTTVGHMKVHTSAQKRKMPVEPMAVLFHSSHDVAEQKPADVKKEQNEGLSVLDPVAMQFHNISDS